MSLTLPTGLTDEHIVEVERLSWRWVFMPSVAYTDYRGYTFFLGGLAAVVAAIVDPAEYNSSVVRWAALGSLSFGALILFFTQRGRRLAIRKTVAQLDRSPGLVTLNEKGVYMYRNTDAGALPIWAAYWATYQSATLGNKVLLLFRAPRSKRFNVIPLAAMSEGQRSELVATLQEHLGAGKVREAMIRKRGAGFYGA